MKYQPKAEDIDEVYREIKQSEEIVKTEPKDYDELYDKLVTCFDRKPCDQDMQKYLECCTEGKGDGDKGAGDGDDDSYVSEGLGDDGGGDGGGDGDGDGDKSKDGDDTGGKGGRGGKGNKGGKKGKGGKGGKGDKDGDGDKDGKGDEGDNDGFSPEKPSEPSEQGNEPDTEEVPKEPEEITPPKPKKKRKKPKRSGKKKKKHDDKTKDCPCDICKFMNKRKHEPDTPLISKLKEEEKRRKLKDYLKIMCHRQCIQNSECRAPLHKCDDIDCDICFCCNPKLSDYCECLNVMQQLQDLLAPNECPELRALKDRICTRLCESL